jgi:hypothetical protein
VANWRNSRHKLAGTDVWKTTPYSGTP